MLSGRSVAVASRSAAAPSAYRLHVTVRPVTVCRAVGKTDLIDAVVEKTGLSKKDSAAALAALIESIQESVAAGERVTVIGFGTFERRDRAARTCRNPKTGEAIQVAATQSPAFKPATGFKDLVAGKSKKA